jgi:transcriptional regulator with XRE-family HTH domain
MAPIGETLRQARMRHELDIADVEARTKIRAKYLRALENEEFGVLPGSTTVRSFLRTYAELLGLDPHPLVEQYRLQHEERDEAEVQPIAAPARGGDRRERRERLAPPAPGGGGGGGPSPLALIAGAVLAVLVLLLVVGLVGGSDDGSQQADQAGERSTTAQERRPARRPGRRRPRVATVVIAPTVPTYVCVDTGPGTETVFEGIMDSRRRFRGRRVRLNLGKTSVRLTANGRNVPLEPSATPVGYDVTPRGARALPAGQRPCA